MKYSALSSTVYIYLLTVRPNEMDLLAGDIGHGDSCI